jgi:replication factor C large subunit
VPGKSANPDPHPLMERVRPDRLDQVIGNPEAVNQLRRWAKAWETSQQPPRLRAAVLAGPPGVGKTTAAIALANDMGWGLVEMNASDARNRTSIEHVAGRTALTNAFSLTGDLLSSRRGQHTLILLDEADCLFSRDTEAPPADPRPTPSFREFLRNRYGSLESLAKAWGMGKGNAPPPFTEWTDIPASGGRSKALRVPPAQRDLADWSETKVRTDLTDRGGLGAIAKLVRETRQPIVLTVNDPSVLNRYSPIFRTAVARVPFWPLREDDLRAVVRKVSLAQKLDISSTAAEAIVRRSRGDLRAALNDLDAISALPAGPAQEALLAPRDSDSDFFDFTREVLDFPRVYRSVEIRNRLDATPDDLLPWIEENLPRASHDPSTRLTAYGELADADVLLSRARRYRAYGLWSYASEVMTGGVSIALSSGGGHAPDRIAFPQFLGQMGRFRIARATRTSIATKVGRMMHVSRRKAVESAMDFLNVAFQSAVAPRATSTAVGFARRLAISLDLTTEEVAHLVGLTPGDDRVQDLVGSPSDGEEEPQDTADSPADQSPSEGAQPPRPEEKQPDHSTGSKKTQRRLADY